MRSESSLRISKRDEPIVMRIQALKAEHPFWGYRRCWASLRYADGLSVNKKRILRIMRMHNLLVPSKRNLKASRTPPRSKPRPTRPNEWWGIDMTKVAVDSFGWIYIVVVLDWYTKRVLGYHIGLQARANHWLKALDMAINRQFPDGVREADLHLMSDNGSQPTAVRFMATCGLLNIKQAFTSYNNPKGNADTERFMRTLKEECLWLRNWMSPFELTDALTSWFSKYNTSYLHSSLGYRTPDAFEQRHYSHQTLLTQA